MLSGNSKLSLSSSFDDDDDGRRARKKESRLEQLTRKAYVELGSLAMKAAAVITSSLAGKRARTVHHRSHDWSTEDNY